MTLQDEEMNRREASRAKPGKAAASQESQGFGGEAPLFGEAWGSGQAPEWPRHIRDLLPLLRSRPGGVRSRAIARLPEPDKRILDFRFWILDCRQAARLPLLSLLLANILYPQSLQPGIQNPKS